MLTACETLTAKNYLIEEELNREPQLPQPLCGYKLLQLFKKIADLERMNWSNHLLFLEERVSQE